MVRRSFLIIVAMAILTISAHAEELLIVQSLRSKMYQEVVTAAHRSCSSAKAKIIILDETAEVDVPRAIRETRAKAVLAIGDKAFRAAIAQRRVPVVGVLTLETQAFPSNAKTIPYLAAPPKYLSVFKSMGKKRVGVVYDGKLLGYVRQADRIAKSMGITLEKREIPSPVGLPTALASLQGANVEALWIVPDTNVVTAGTVEPLLKFASANNIPAIVFSKTYLKVGATLAIEPDRTSIGKQAGRMLCQAIEDGIVPEEPTVASSFFSQCGNEELGRRLGISSSVFESTCDN
ncbi:hypothetical protein A2G06_16445 (plasmid) [Geobacter anodireducens]|nr:hypothetical protein A2G06_16445 [Geobacter anodireducens]